MLACPARRRMLMTRLRMAAMTWGPVPVRGGEIFAEGDVADPVELVLDLPVAADPGGELGRLGLAGGQ